MIRLDYFNELFDKVNEIIDVLRIVERSDDRIYKYINKKVDKYDDIYEIYLDLVRQQKEIKDIINNLPTVEYDITDEIECVDFSYMNIEYVKGEGFGSKPIIIIEEVEEINVNS